ncbi:AIR synthase-related protein (plasmid) [Haloferacaceae archaeon DSL9]
MPETGKIDREFFLAHVASNLGADRDDVLLGPTHGVDFGLFAAGDDQVVVATDPISILPDLGWERAGRFAIRIVLSDVAVSGRLPTHLSLSLALPAEMTAAQFQAVWDAIVAECTALGVRVVAERIGQHPHSSFPWVGSATSLAVGTADTVVYPNGARPGDAVVVTNGPAVEATGLFATLFPDQISLPLDTIQRGQALLDEITPVRDAITAAGAGAVSAMHDATEGGLHGAFHEVASSADVRLELAREAIPVRHGVVEIADALGMNPWNATSSGTLVVTAPPAEARAVVAALDARDTAAAVVGSVAVGSGVRIDGEATTKPDGDSSWPVYERLLRA